MHSIQTIVQSLHPWIRAFELTSLVADNLAGEAFRQAFERTLLPLLFVYCLGLEVANPVQQEAKGARGHLQSGRQEHQHLSLDRLAEKVIRVVASKRR
jgi:hypothetical protein